MSHCRAELETKASSDQDLFETVWKRYTSELFHRCLIWMGGDLTDGQEAFSRAAVTVYRKLREHFPSDPGNVPELRGWLLRLTYNTCMDLHRENRRRLDAPMAPELDLDLLSTGTGKPPFWPAPPEDPERSFLAKELQGFLARAIHELPARLRETVLCQLTFVSGREIAEFLGITEVNVRKRLQEARAILRLRLRDYRSGRMRSPSPPPRGDEEPRVSEVRPRGSGPWRVHAVRPVQIRLGSGVETEALLSLDYPPRQASVRRRSSLESYIREHPSGWKRRLELGRHSLEEGRLEEAVSQLEPVVQAQPHHVQPWVALATAYDLLERPEDAATACGRALAGVKGSANLLFLQGLRERFLGRTAEAERAWEAACEAAPERSLPRVALARLRLATGRPAEALRDLDAALAADPADVAALTLGQDALRLAGRPAESRRRAARALEIDGANVPALFLWSAARCHASGGRPPQDSVERRRWLKLQGLARKRADARRVLAFCHACRGDSAGAERLLVDLTRERPHLRQGWLELARLLDWLGRSWEAAEALGWARGLGEQSREASLLSCRIAVRAGLRERALAGIDGLLESHGEAWDTASTAAWVLTSLDHDPARALELSHAASRLQPGLPAAWIEHGHILARWGRQSEAAEAFATARELLPEGTGLDLAVPAETGGPEAGKAAGFRELEARWKAVAQLSEPGFSGFF